MKKIIAAALFLFAFSVNLFGVDVAIIADKYEIVEGDRVKATILRGDMQGDLEVAYSVGAPKLPIANVIASSSFGGTLRYLTDGKLDTCWMNGGNAKNDAKDDTPAVLIKLAEPAIVGEIKIASYVNPWHEFRTVKDVVVELSFDGENFTPAMQIMCRRGYLETVSVFETFPLPIEARQTPVQFIRLKVLSNYAREFYNGTSYDGDSANGSLVGMAEIEVLGVGVGSTVAAPATGKVTILDGQSSVDFNIQTINDEFIYGDKIMEIRIEPSASYTLDPVHKAHILVKDNDFGPQVSVTATKPEADFANNSVGEITFKRSNTNGELIVRYTTANVPLELQYIGASSLFHNSPLTNLTDNSLSTNWMNSGNADRESEQDDEPWIVFTFDEVYPVGMMRIANYANRGHSFRSVKDIEVLAAENENDFVSIGFTTLRRTLDSSTVGEFQDIPLGGLTARRIAFKILSNYNTEYYKGTSFDKGGTANGSLVGLSEVQFFTGSTLNFKDIAEELTNYVVFAPGQDTVTVTLTPNKITGNKTVDITILEDYTRYTVDLSSINATVTVK